MRSRAHIGSHPIHPMLVPLPIGLAFGTLGVDVIAWTRTDPAWWSVGQALGIATVLTGLLAAAPGLVDFFLAVPPDSQAHDRAVRHLIANGSGLLAFGIAQAVRAALPSTAPWALELAGIACFGVGGYLGGDLVYRNQIGVDHRYASNGEWSELRLSDVQAAPVVGHVGDLRPGQMKLVRVNDLRVVVARTDEGWTAFEDHCPHMGGPLSDGVLAGDCVQCPWHGSQFDVRTGELLAGPAGTAIRTWRVQQEGEELRLILAEHGTHPTHGIAAPAPPLPM
jgi:nitrite reductase/ring-hydroxylating ferredoxin subunit/uncharacterized membrane protein